MTEANDLLVSAVGNWFGSDRMVAERPGVELRGCSLVYVPFGGGMSVVPHIPAKKLVVSDLHTHVINLGKVIADAVLGPKLYRRLRREVFHPDTLAAAQDRCRQRNAAADNSLFASDEVADLFDPLEWAADYAITTWMARGGIGGTKGEFGGALPVRFSPGGGGSGQRFHNWVASLPAWRRTLRRCEFVVADAFDVLAKCADDRKCGYYVDAPWPDAGDGYTHAFTPVHQRRLAKLLGGIRHARVVVRYGDHPLIRELYPADRWTWLTYPSRAQSNGIFNEVLIVNGPSYSAAVAA